MNYRSLYKLFKGQIPKDDSGRLFDIHHIDGNRENNTILNLVAVSIEDHYDIHYLQGDYGACISIAKRMNRTPHDTSELARQRELQKVVNGTHRFLGDTLQRKKMKEGRHHFMNKDWQTAKERAKASVGNHIWQKTIKCDKCGAMHRLCNIKKHQRGKHCVQGVV